MGPRPHLSFSACKTTFRITSLHGSQTSRVILYMQNNVISIRITSLYWSEPSSPAFARKTATFGPELRVSMCPRLRLLFCECKTAWLAPELQDSEGPKPHLWFFAFKTAPSAPELQVTLGQSPHLWFCAFTTSVLWPELIVSMGPRPHLSFCAYKTA